MYGIYYVYFFIPVSASCSVGSIFLPRRKRKKEDCIKNCFFPSPSRFPISSWWWYEMNTEEINEYRRCVVAAAASKKNCMNVLLTKKWARLLHPIFRDRSASLHYINSECWGGTLQRTPEEGRASETKFWERQEEGEYVDYDEDDRLTIFPLNHFFCLFSYYSAVHHSLQTLTLSSRILWLFYLFHFFILVSVSFLWLLLFFTIISTTSFPRLSETWLAEPN